MNGSNERTNSILKAIQLGYEKSNDAVNNTTIITEHERGSKTVTSFYKKGKAIWCKMVTGCIENKSRVYKVNSDSPYIRDLGRYWYLGDEEKKCINYLLSH